MSSTPFSTTPSAGAPATRPAVGTGPAKIDPTKQVSTSPAGAVTATAASVAQKASTSKRNLLMGGGAGAVVLAAVITLLVWRPWTAEPPRLNDPPEKIVKFVASADFESLPFARQRTYMEHLDKIEDQVKKAHDGNTISDEEYSAAKQAAWYGKRLNRMANYVKEPAGAKRNAYIDKLLDKRAKKKEKEEEDDVVKPAKAPKSGTSVKRDDSREDEQIAKWPVEVQAQWNEYMQAYRDRKELRKEHEAAATQLSVPAVPVVPAKVPTPKPAAK